jgi:predicted PurR-regulated permease PerM
MVRIVQIALVVVLAFGITGCSGSSEIKDLIKAMNDYADAVDQNKSRAELEAMNKKITTLQIKFNEMSDSKKMNLGKLGEELNAAMERHSKATKIFLDRMMEKGGKF